MRYDTDEAENRLYTMSTWKLSSFLTHFSFRVQGELFLMILHFRHVGGMWAYHVQVVLVILGSLGNGGLQTGRPSQHGGKIHMLIYVYE